MVGSSLIALHLLYDQRKKRGTMKDTLHALTILLNVPFALSWCSFPKLKSAGGVWEQVEGSRRPTMIPSPAPSCNTLLWAVADEAASTNDDDFGSSPTKSIADYTLGLHGGKYQFGDSAVSTVGQDFAASLYASAEENGVSDVDYTSETVPAWALRLSDLTGTSLQVYSSNIEQLPPNGQVTIVNEEMTWEKFYAFVVPRPEVGGDGGSAESAATVEPWVGMLSPRGGQAVLQVTLSPGRSSNPTWLVVGTECERWIYSLP